MIPEIKQSAVAQALQSAFGVSEFDDIKQLTTGLSSALIYRIVVKEKPHLLRVITRTDAISDPTHYYGCMKIASEAGLAPHTWYAGIADRISITDFVEVKPFDSEEAKRRLPDILKRLHALPAFAYRLNYLDTMDGMVRRFLSLKMLPESMTDEAFGQYKRIKAIYPRNASDLVSCHNDLKPDNILFDGKQVWLVDWEAAFLNDRYLDLATVGNFILTNEHEEREYLSRYFDGVVGEHHYARFFLMRQMLHMFYTAIFLLSRTPGAQTDLNLPVPDFRALNNDLFEGKISMAHDAEKQQYALVHLNQLLLNLRLKKFEDCMKLVGEYAW